MLDFRISLIDQHRKEKFQSLFLGKLEYEESLFLNKIDSFDVSKDEKSYLLSVLSFAKNQSYGDHVLLKHYVSHPIRVAIYVADWMIRQSTFNASVLVSAIIHNIIEKKIMDSNEIIHRFGDKVSMLISTLTVDREAQKLSGWAESYYGEISKIGIEASIIKAYDKLDNLYAICLNPSKEDRYLYISEIEKYILPIFKELDSKVFLYAEALVNKSYQQKHISIADAIKEVS